MIFNKECKNHERNKACIQSISKGDNSRQMARQTPLPALCTSSDGHLSIYQVSFNSLLYFQRYAPDKLLIAEIKKGSNSVNTGDRFGSCILQFLSWPSISVSSFIYLSSILLDKLDCKN